MDKLQKIGAWLWLYKERLIFVIMVGVLVRQVYIVFDPPPPPPTPPLTPPMQSVPVEMMPPQLPSVIIPPGTPMTYSEITRGNIFWKDAATGSSSPSAPDKPKVTLMNIVNANSAQLKTPSSSRGTFKSVGAEFDGFTLESIDQASGTVVIVDQSNGQRITLEK